LAWPHVARALASRSAQPVRAEFRNLVADSAMGGVWVALMQFNLLPSALIVTMLSVDKISAGGVRLLGRGTAFLVAACAATPAAQGFAFEPATPGWVIVACLPFLAAYPLAISAVTHRLANHVVRQNRRLVELSRTDALTGLANRRQCLWMAEQELARHHRTGRPAVLIELDVDRFKRINDRYGHAKGDVILRGLTAILRECTRSSDTVARYGGDEFVILMPETDLAGATEVAHRIRERVAALNSPDTPDVECTVSLGLAQAHAEMADVEDWIQQADAALYRAKAAGRDRFATALAPVGAAPVVRPVPPKQRSAVG
jgi:diguanylate cyclase